MQGDGPNVAPRGYWNDQFTFVQLQYEFISGDCRVAGQCPSHGCHSGDYATECPQSVNTRIGLPGGTFLTFYDFDSIGPRTEPGTLPQPSPPLCSDGSHIAPVSISRRARHGRLRDANRGAANGTAGAADRPALPMSSGC